jgi:hypothetical protein
VVDVRRILVDGRNVQGALARGTAGGSLPTHVFIAQLRAAIPADATLELILDGFPSGGVVGRVGPRFDVAYSRHQSADRTIADRVEKAAQELGPIGVDGVLIVSDDREVGDQARRHGAQVVGTAWLTDRIRAASGSATGATDRQPPGIAGGRVRAGTSIGQGRAPRLARSQRTGRDSR